MSFLQLVFGPKTLGLIRTSFLLSWLLRNYAVNTLKHGNLCDTLCFRKKIITQFSLIVRFKEKPRPATHQSADTFQCKQPQRKLSGACLLMGEQVNTCVCARGKSAVKKRGTLDFPGKSSRKIILGQGLLLCFIFDLFVCWLKHLGIFKHNIDTTFYFPEQQSQFFFK